MMKNKAEVLKQCLIPYPLSVYLQTTQSRRFREETPLSVRFVRCFKEPCRKKNSRLNLRFLSPFLGSQILPAATARSFLHLP